MNDTFAERHPLLTDLAWMIPVAALSVVVVGDEHLPNRPVVELALSAAQLLPLLWRRSRPLLVFVIVSAVACVQIVMAWPIILADVGLAVALFYVASLCQLRYAVVALVAAGLGQIAWIIRYPADSVPPMPVALMLAIVLIWTAGRYAGARLLVVQGLRERALLAQEAAENDACAAVLDERGRIARELHDTIAHNVSVMVVQAEGARLVMEHDPETAASALRQVVESGQTALSDMREMVAMFRDQPPRPWPSRLQTLARRMEEAGLHVDLQIEGEPPQEMRRLVHSVVREGLTNALKHAGPGANVTVRLVFSPVAAEMTIEDDGAGHRMRLIGGGNGLTGMREQLALWGGSLETRHRRTGGFVLTVRLPYARRLSDAA